MDLISPPITDLQLYIHIPLFVADMCSLKLLSVSLIVVSGFFSFVLSQSKTLSWLKGVTKLLSN